MSLRKKIKRKERKIQDRNKKIKETLGHNKLEKDSILNERFGITEGKREG